jgi:hypothetical protein
MRRARTGLWLPEKHVKLAPIAGGAAKTYAAWNGTQATTAPFAPVALAASTTKTLLQIQAPSTKGFRVVCWGISFNAVAATPVQCELIDTAAVAATVTTYASTDIVKTGGPNDEASLVTLGTAASGFTATAEGTTTVGRTLDYQLVAQAYVIQGPLGREQGEIPVSHNLRVRATSAAVISAVCFVVWEE